MSVCRGCETLLTERNARVVRRNRDGSPGFNGACRECETKESKERDARKVRLPMVPIREDLNDRLNDMADRVTISRNKLVEAAIENFLAEFDPVVHPCCGCTCSVCADGHQTGTLDRDHTPACKKRFFSDVATPS